MPSSLHFSDQELACSCCGVNGCTQALVNLLEHLRTVLQKPIIVNSAYRCPKHNRAVGGAPGSMHLQGKAADIRVEGMTAAELYEVIKNVPHVYGVGRADHQNYLHVDVRSNPAKWCYNSQGQQIPWYEPSGVSV